ncbi:hypothetical protein V8D89_010641 [Ganoderma adspersum]
MWNVGTAVRLSQKRTVNIARVRAANAPHYIRQFFANYPTFDYQIDAPFLKEFKRLCKHMEWERPVNVTKEAWKEKGKAQEEAKGLAKSALKVAMVDQFNHTYGRDADNLAAWQQLCNALGFKRIPNKVADCKWAPDPENPVPTFPNEAALSEHTKEEEKYFPRDEINAGNTMGSVGTGLAGTVVDVDETRGLGLRTRDGCTYSSVRVPDGALVVVSGLKVAVMGRHVPVGSG